MRALFLFLFPVCVVAQVHTHQWVNFTNGQNIASLATHGNYVWASTNGGLVRYNTLTGVSDYFNKGNAGLPVNSAQNIICDSSGKVWSYVSNRCLFSFDGTNYTEYNSQNSSIPSLQITGICTDKNNNIWLGTYAGLIKFDGVNFLLFDATTSNLPTVNMFDLTSDPQNNIWIASPDSGLIKFNGTSFQSYKTSNSGINSNYVYKVCSADTGVWLATGVGNVMKFDGSNWNLFDSTNGFVINWPLFIYRNQNNKVWFGSNMGLLSYSTGVFSLLTNQNSPLVNNTVVSVVTDSLNNLYVANGIDPGDTYPKQGLYNLTSAQAIKISTSNSTLPSNLVYSQFIDKYKRIWFGTYEGVAMFDGVNWFAFDSLNKNLPGKTVYAVALDGNDNLWLGTYGGLVKYNGTAITVFDSSNTNISTDKIIEITIKDDTAIWIGTFGNGFMRFNSSGPVAEYNTQNSPLTSDSVRVIRFDMENNLWVGTEGGGLIKIDTAGNWTVYAGNALPNDFVTGIDIDSMDRKWISTYNFAGGITRIDNTGLTHWTTQNSQIPTFDIKTIKWSANGTVYASAGGCTYACVMPFGLFEMDTLTQSWTIHNLLNSGIGSLDITKVDKDENGNVWLATSDGISIIKNAPFVTGVKDLADEKHKLNFFPNPAGGSVLVELPVVNKPLRAFIKLYSINGQIIYAYPLQHTPASPFVVITLPADLANGIYFLQYTSENFISTEKLIIEK